MFNLPAQYLISHISANWMCFSGSKFLISAGPEIFFYTNFKAIINQKYQFFGIKITDFRPTGFVFLIPSRFQRATARALTPNS